MDEKIFNRVGRIGPDSPFVFEHWTREDEFWDQVRMNINEALLIWFKDNSKKEHGWTFQINVEFVFGEKSEKRTYTAPFEVNKREPVSDFQELFGLKHCERLASLARKDIKMDELKMFTVSFTRILRW